MVNFHDLVFSHCFLVFVFFALKDPIGNKPVISAFIGYPGSFIFNFLRFFSLLFNRSILKLTSCNILYIILLMYGVSLDETSYFV